MQYKVPQNIDIEDKVIGPLTLRQFTIILIATGIIMTFYFMFQGPMKILFYLLSFIVGALAIVVAFMKYGDQNFEVFIFSAIKTFTNPRQRVWRKETFAELPKEVPQHAPVTAKATAKKDLTQVRSDLQRLAEVVDTGGVVELAGKDRVIPFQTGRPVEDKETPDLLGKTESSPAVDKILEVGKKLAPKREQTIAEMTKPAEKYDYEEIKIKKF